MNHTWKLEKYARWSNVTNDWQITNTDKDHELRLTLTKSKHLVISHGHHTVQENLSLWNAVTTLKGFVKEDSMLVVSQIKLNESRRFRIQFANDGGHTALLNCQQAASILSTLMPVNDLTQKSNTSEPTPSIIPLSTLVEMMADRSAMPSAYREAANVPSNSLGSLVRLCLTDFNFPAFVGQVEKELKTIQKK